MSGSGPLVFTLFWERGRVRVTTTWADFKVLCRFILFVVLLVEVLSWGRGEGRGEGRVEGRGDRGRVLDLVAVLSGAAFLAGFSVPELRDDLGLPE